MRCLVRVLVLVVVVCGVVVCVPGFAFGLPVGRSYELVSEPYTGGFGASHIEAVADDGESVAYFSPGVFRGAPSGLGGGINNIASYLARRGPSGWSTTPFMPPAVLMPSIEDRDMSPALESTLAFGFPALNAEAGSFELVTGEFRLYRPETPDDVGDWELAGRELKTLNETPLLVAYEGADIIFCDLLFENQFSADPLILEEEEKEAEGQLFEVTRGCNNESPEVRTVGVNNESGNENKVISIKCRVGIGNESYEGEHENSFHAISADGSQVFFTTCIDNKHEDHQLFVRLAGSHTLEVSKPLTESGSCGEQIPCPGAADRASASFAGASEDGSQVYFTSAAPLTGDTEDSSTNLYLARIGCPESEPGCPVAKRVVTSLVQVSQDPNSSGTPSVQEAADVQGVVKVAPDGSRIYFVATGDLLSETERFSLEGEGRPVPHVGADNLYVYDDGEPSKIAFIGDLCSGYEVSGPTVNEDVFTKGPFADPSCSGTGTDLALWTNGGEAQTAGAEGDFLVFSTYAQLTADDTDTAKDVYRYYASNGELDRVSTGENGSDSNGNNNEFDASIAEGHEGGIVRDEYEMDNNAISEDGSRIIFTTAEPLSPGATNGLVNLYEWHKEPGTSEGVVSLISGGSAANPVEDAVISLDGHNIFFVTTQSLVTSETDGEPGVYDARIDGGFPVPAAPLAECKDEGCHGPLSVPVPVLVPGSVSQAPGGNFSAPLAPKPKVKSKTPVRCSKGKKLNHGKCVKAKSKKKGKAKKASDDRRSK